MDKSTGGSIFGVLGRDLGEKDGDIDAPRMFVSQNSDARMEGNTTQSTLKLNKGKSNQRSITKSTTNKGKGKGIAISSGVKPTLRILKSAGHGAEVSTGFGFSTNEDIPIFQTNKDQQVGTLLRFQVIRMDTTLTGSKNQVVKMV